MPSTLHHTPIFQVKTKLIILRNHNGFYASCENAGIIFYQPQNLGADRFQRILRDLLAPAEAFSLFLIRSTVPADTTVARYSFVGLAAMGAKDQTCEFAQLRFGSMRSLCSQAREQVLHSLKGLLVNNGGV